MIFEQKSCLQQWKKISVAFCKKDWKSDNNNLCVARKITRTKKTIKRKKCLECLLFVAKKIKEKTSDNKYIEHVTNYIYENEKDFKILKIHFVTK